MFLNALAGSGEDFSGFSAVYAKHFPQKAARSIVGDFKVPETFVDWDRGGTAVAMVRNSFRHRIVTEGTDFLTQAVDTLVDGGVFVTDPAAAKVVTPARTSLPALQHLQDPVSFNGTSGDNQTWMYVNSTPQ